MSDKSKIEWTESTWNPVLGCDKISAGCKNCYAIRTAWRLQHNPDPTVAKAFEGLTAIEGGKPNWTGRINVAGHRLDQPLRWKRPRRIFVNSQSDLFHDGVNEDAIETIFAVMALTPQHTFQILTKRPHRMLSFLQKNSTGGRIFHLAGNMGTPQSGSWPLPNVWLGVSCEDQKTADERIPLLLQTPAAVRWISAEPLLGHIDLIGVPVHNAPPNSPPDYCSSALWGDPRMNWVVVGGESGPGARPMHPDWARSLRDECVAAKVPFFFKQWGEYIFDATPDQSKSPSPDIVHKGTFRRVGKKAAGRLLDGKEWNQYPEAK